CTNCRKKHIKCSEGVTCTYCASYNLQCTYAKSFKKRGPKAANRATNGFENYFYEAVNTEQDHVLTSNEFQFGVSTPYYFNGSEEPQPIQSDFFPYQVHIDTNYIMQNNNTPVNFKPQPIQSDFFPYQVHIDTNYIMQNNNTPVNFNDTFSLPNNSSSSPSSSSIASNLGYLFGFWGDHIEAGSVISNPFQVFLFFKYSQKTEGEEIIYFSIDLPDIKPFIGITRSKKPRVPDKDSEIILKDLVNSYLKILDTWISEFERLEESNLNLRIKPWKSESKKMNIKSSKIIKYLQELVLEKKKKSLKMKSNSKQISELEKTKIKHPLTIKISPMWSSIKKPSTLIFAIKMGPEKPKSKK
ncbi:8776_t:CDS:2, partial [Dentiscutata erythropus]